MLTPRGPAFRAPAPHALWKLWEATGAAPAQGGRRGPEDQVAGVASGLQGPCCWVCRGCIVASHLWTPGPRSPRGAGTVIYGDLECHQLRGAQAHTRPSPTLRPAQEIRVGAHTLKGTHTAHPPCDKPRGASSSAESPQVPKTKVTDVSSSLSPTPAGPPPSGGALPRRPMSGACPGFEGGPHEPSQMTSTLGHHAAHPAGGHLRAGR